MCFVIGAIISALIKPQNPKKLNRDLISPAFYTFFRWFPFLACLIGQEKDFEADIGIDYVSVLVSYIKIVNLVSYVLFKSFVIVL